jgi:fatty-acyl-CoA synthase
METPLTPLEFMRRARRLYPGREAVVDGARRFTYAQFFERCDRWSAVLQALGVAPGDRVAYIAPNTHAQLESFYAVPQIGAVLVPLNYRLAADEFRYLIEHSGATVVCADGDYLTAVDRIRPHLRGVRHFVALDRTRDGWLDYEGLLAASSGEPRRPDIAERDLLTINYTSGTTSRPKGVMITHRNAWMNSIGMLTHIQMSPADAYLWTLPMFHANGWTFTWTVTAAGAKHVCLRKVEPATVFRLATAENVTWMCAAPTVLIALAGAPAELKGFAPRGVQVMTAGAPPAAVTIERLEDGLGWSVIQIYGLTETAPAISICEPRPEHQGLTAAERARIKARQGVELITSGELRVVDEGGAEVPADGATVGEIVARGNVVMAGYYQDPEATNKVMGDGWFHTGDAAVVHPDGSPSRSSSARSRSRASRASASCSATTSSSSSSTPPTARSSAIPLYPRVPMPETMRELVGRYEYGRVKHRLYEIVNDLVLANPAAARRRPRVPGYYVHDVARSARWRR